ncbi:MAG: 4a-hydroxytetrahydrobiopterin dehydratase [Gammaproteobacteria bacterium]|nr:4a-hydroxytetrahydrobiopterin dehydratase [Gammaproteobacteria bacterium]MCH9744028.1 4a-hydroxytetrahydrobiopterin dehydratase [Gammaproteobacteria bacterium]
MTDALEKRCKPCEAGIPPLSKEKIQELLKQVADWKVNEDLTVITREFKFKNFLRTMAFVNAVAYVANQEGHHPDMHVGYNYCTIDFSTHAIDGLSTNDFICARRVNELAA